MKKLRTYKKLNKNTMNKIPFIVFFCIIICSIILLNIYASNTSKNAIIMINEKIDSIIYQFFNELITNDVINKNSVNDILEINKNNKDEILSVSYNIEKSYEILTEVSNILSKGLNDLERGVIDVNYYDKYLSPSLNGLVLEIPFFLGSKNIFLNNLGPRIPVLINFNETLLTNIKTKVTNYGFNNALLELYITVEMQKLIITPINKDNSKFNYDILVGALVVNGSVPEFYGSEIISSSGILDIPIKA